MGHKRRHHFSKGKHSSKNAKRKKLNLLTISASLRADQRDSVKGQAQPLESETSSRLKSNTTANRAGSQLDSPEDSEEDVPIIKQLMTEIGMQSSDSDGDTSVRSNEEDLQDEDVSEDDLEADSDVPETDQEDEVQENLKLRGSQVHPDRSQAGDKLGRELNQPSMQKSDTEQSDKEDIDEKDIEEAENLDEEDAEDDSDHGSVEDDEEDAGLVLKESDPFFQHFEKDQDISELAENSSSKWQKHVVKISGMGPCFQFIKTAKFVGSIHTQSDLRHLHVKHQLCSQVCHTNTELAGVSLKPGASLTALQQSLFQVINSYQDLLYPKQTVHNLEEIRLVYTLHALNHILKTRSRIIAHNSKLKSKTDDNTEYRDQGLTRPKVLILLPYRDRALKTAHMIINLLSTSEKTSVSNKNRFDNEFSELEKSDLLEAKFKPEDFRLTFQGNTDDNFRVGISVSKKSLRLYSPFYESDIILASPLGLRMIIGSEDDKQRDFDFLSSIEMLVIDQADVLLMQNWDHLAHIFQHLHLQPRQYHNVDFSRVRMWSINGWAKHYRQTIMFSSVFFPEILNLFDKHCHNYAGKILVEKEEKLGSIRCSMTNAPQTFHRVACRNPAGLSQMTAKLDYFKKKIVPAQTSAGMKQTLVYCNYLSFVHLRNHFRESELDFLFINEYDTEKHKRNARIHFRKRHPHFLLYTERLHFFYRYRLRGIHHIVWFDLPHYPQFYPELLNLMETSRHACTSTALFTSFEAQKLSEIVGSRRAAQMLSSDKTVNMITVS